MSIEQKHPCETCATPVTPFSAGSSPTPEASYPKTYYGSGAPSAGGSYSAGDWYVDTANHATYSYRCVSEANNRYEWVLATPDVSSRLSGYVYRSPLTSGSTTLPTEIGQILSAYLTSAQSDDRYPTKAQFNQLSETVSSMSSTNAVYRNGGALVDRNLDTILAGYVSASSVSDPSSAIGQALSAKQGALTAGTGIAISPTGVISSTAQAVSVVTASVNGLMSAEDKVYLDSIPSELSGKQDTLTPANFGSHLTFSNGVVSADYPPLSSSLVDGLMSAADKRKLDGLSTSGSDPYVLPQATMSTRGGVLVYGEAVGDYQTVDGVSSVVTPDGFKPVRRGTSGILYCPDIVAYAATDQRLGLLKVYGSSLGDVTGSGSSTPSGYTPLRIGASGIGYCKLPEVATASDAGLVKIADAAISDLTSGLNPTRATPSGYSPVRIGTSGALYWKEPVAATSEVYGTVKVSDQSIASADAWRFRKCRKDSSGVVRYEAFGTILDTLNPTVDNETTTSGDTQTYSVESESRTSITVGAMSTSLQNLVFKIPAATDGEPFCRDFTAIVTFPSNWTSSNSLKVHLKCGDSAMDLLGVTGTYVKFESAVAGDVVMIDFREISRNKFFTEVRKLTAVVDPPVTPVDSGGGDSE